VDSWAVSFEEAIAAALGPLGVCAAPEQLALFRRHFEAVLLANESMNLTRITDPPEAAIKHYADSLALLAWAEREGIKDAKILDVGTGAGFPAVPIAVMRPEWRVTALDGTRKKAEFVGRVAAELGLKNLKAEHGHSDHWMTVERFDVVTTRAVASLAHCMRTSHRLIRKGGRLIAYKTATLANEEMSEARQVCGELGMEMEPPFLYELEWNAEKMARALYPVRHVS
jgi:16S rRNA (guanine527-N7)-methyltransferase